MLDDVISQAADEPITQAAEVQETTTDEVSPQSEPQKEKPLTAEEYRQIAREEATRVAQSQVAKSENRTNQRIQERFAALEANKSVLKLTDEQVQTAQDAIIKEETMKAYQPQPSGQQASSPQGQAPTDDMIRQQVEFVYGQIQTVFDEAGAEVTPNDPEYKQIEAAMSDPKGSLAKTLLAAGKAAETKAARVLAHKDTAKARVTGGGSSTNSTTKSLTAEEKISKGLKNSTWPSETPQK